MCYSLWCWVVVLVVIQIVRHSLILADISMLFAVKAGWWFCLLATIGAVACAGWIAGLWIGILWIVSSRLVVNILPPKLTSRYESNLQAFQFTDQLQRQFRYP